MVSSHYDELADSDLWSLVQQSDQDAFEAIYHRHVASVLRCCLGRLRSTAHLADHTIRAEEVTSDVFLTAWRRKTDITVDESIRPWLLTVAVALCNNSNRGEQRRSRLRARLIRSIDPSSDNSPADLAITDDLIRRVATAISALTTGDAQVARLCILGGASTRQVALALHIPEGTVKSRLYRARRLLRPVLRPDPRALPS